MAGNYFISCLDSELKKKLSAMFGCVTAEIDPIYQHLVGAKHRTKYDILVHTFPDSEEEISARKFPIPTDSIPYGKSCLGKDESIS